jgi:pilus assembly protein Flp/PilA
MHALKTLVGRFVREDEGASLAEYALLLGVITAALIGVIAAFRDNLTQVFQNTGTDLQAGQTAGGGN